MTESNELKRRDIYLNKLIGFQDTEPVKVITGIRRCGKSSLLKLMVQHLKQTGISSEQIIEMNFESHDYRGMNADDIYLYVKERIIPEKRMYLFFDELQRIEAWEEAINSFRVDFNCDIYVTGSNAYLLSSEYATYLSGRCVEIKMLPLSFREFLSFHDFTVRETQSALGGRRKQVFDQNGERYELKEVFDAYMRFGGMPGIADMGLEQEKALTLLDGIYSTVVIRDILEREKRKGQRNITDPVLLKKIILFLADNIADDVLEYLSQEDRGYSLVKLPHHGSANNISDDFVECIESDTYLVSTNSEKYNHPDIETLAKIACKRTEYVKRIYFNYKIDKVADFEKKIYGMNDIEFVYLGEGQKIYL